MEILFGSLPYDEVLRFLQATDCEFQVPLAQKLDIPEYAAKLARYSMFAYAKEGDGIIGMISCYMNRPPRGYISHVCVRSEHQGTGLFTKLFARIVGEAKAKGIESLTLEADDFNTGARRLYTRLGFRCVEKASAHSDYFEYDIRQHHDAAPSDIPTDPHTT